MTDVRRQPNPGALPGPFDDPSTNIGASWRFAGREDQSAAEIKEKIAREEAGEKRTGELFNKFMSAATLSDKPLQEIQKLDALDRQRKAQWLATQQRRRNRTAEQKRQDESADFEKQRLDSERLQRQWRGKESENIDARLAKEREKEKREQEKRVKLADEFRRAHATKKTKKAKKAFELWHNSARTSANVHQLSHENELEEQQSVDNEGLAEKLQNFDVQRQQQLSSGERAIIEHEIRLYSSIIGILQNRRLQ